MKFICPDCNISQVAIPSGNTGKEQIVYDDLRQGESVLKLVVRYTRLQF